MMLQFQKYLSILTVSVMSVGVLAVVPVSAQSGSESSENRVRAAERAEEARSRAAEKAEEAKLRAEERRAVNEVKPTDDAATGPSDKNRQKALKLLAKERLGKPTKS